ncbi:MAG TPA: hypothetical protein VN032_06940 [Thermoanaerobaculia bacterium]|jgi:hypothetical protein|nr:hypothetical protein [Thermoanaerobaculia bacterium]
MVPYRGAAEIVSRLELSAAAEVLLVDPPPELEAMFAAAASAQQSIRSAEGRTVRSVKESFDLILLWQESRVGSRAVFEAAVKRLAPGGRLWVVTALRKVSGPRTPAIHRIELPDLKKAFEKAGLVNDREARLSAWHVAYRFVARPGPAT